MTQLGLAAYHGQDYDRFGHLMSDKLKQLVELGQFQPPLTAELADRLLMEYCQELATVLARVDALITPVTTGVAPLG
jgi:Asp-tRNA(Asn)/Glu-tRNA(Gln) amidotransferase A subunit family amidase